MYPMFLRIVLVLASVVVFVGEASADRGFRDIDGTGARAATAVRPGPVRAYSGAGMGLGQVRQSAVMRAVAPGKRNGGDLASVCLENAAGGAAAGAMSQ